MVRQPLDSATPTNAGRLPRRSPHLPRGTLTGTSGNALAEHVTMHSKQLLRNARTAHRTATLPGHTRWAVPLTARGQGHPEPPSGETDSRPAPIPGRVRGTLNPAGRAETPEAGRTGERGSRGQVLSTRSSNPGSRLPPTSYALAVRVLRGIRDLALGLWWTVVINHIPGTFPWYVPWWALLFTAGLLIGWWTA